MKISNKRGDKEIECIDDTILLPDNNVLLPPLTAVRLAAEQKFGRAAVRVRQFMEEQIKVMCEANMPLTGAVIKEYYEGVFSLMSFPTETEMHRIIDHAYPSGSEEWTQAVQLLNQKIKDPKLKTGLAEYLLAEATQRHQVANCIRSSPNLGIDYRGREQYCRLVQYILEKTPNMKIAETDIDLTASACVLAAEKQKPVFVLSYDNHVASILLAIKEKMPTTQVYDSYAAYKFHENVEVMFLKRINGEDLKEFKPRVAGCIFPQ